MAFLVCQVTLNIPKGLSLADTSDIQSLTQELRDLPGGEDPGDAITGTFI